MSEHFENKTLNKIIITATSPEIARSFHAQRFRYWKNVKHNDPTAWF